MIGPSLIKSIRQLPGLLMLSGIISAGTQAQIVFQAEDATIYQGAVENEHAGYTGSGYVNGDNVTGSYVEWEVSMADSGKQFLTVFYANGTTTDRPMEIQVNGVVAVALLSFPGSGDWTDWRSTEAMPVVLNEGLNQIRATAITDNGGPNLDKIEISEEVNYSLNLTVFGSGTLTIDPEQDFYAPGTTVSVTAHAGECFTFQGWKGDLASSDSSISVVMDSTVHLAAFFLRTGVYAETTRQIGWSTTSGGTTGGAGGTQVTVSSQAKLESYLSSSSPYIIRIEGTIEVTPFGYEMPVGSNTTLVGIGDDATIRGGGLHISGVSNVIVRNLHFRDAFVTFEGKDTDYDAIEINNSTNVWINHCDLSRFDDGLIDIKNAADFVTVSWCRFHNHNKVMLIGADDGDIQDIGHLNVTVHHNWFDGEGGIGLHQRVPRVRYGKVHVFNNFYNKMVIRGPLAAWEADMVIENCYFKDSHDPHPVEGNTSDSKLAARGNIYDNSNGRKDTKNAASAFNPSDYYSYALHEAADVPSLVMIGAGVTGREEIGDSTAEPCIPAFVEEQVPGKITGTPSGLSRIFPNPADGPVSIHYALDRTSTIRLEIYDSEGRMVERLLDDVRPAGEYRIEFNTGKLRPGIYVIRMATPGRISTKKMVCIK